MDVDFYSEIDVDPGLVLMKDERGMLDEKGIEGDTHGLRRPVKHGSQRVKRKSAASQEAGPKVAISATQHHLVVIVKRNEKKNQSDGIKSKAEVGLRKLRAK